MKEIQICNRKTNRSLICTLRTLQPQEAQPVFDFQQQQLQYISDPQTFVPLSLEEWAHLMAGGGFAEGVFFEGALVYVMGCLYPAIGEDSLGEDVGLTALQQTKSAYLEVAVVREDFKGFGIHKMLICHCIEKLAQDGRTSYILSTVSPYNLPSLAGELQNGMHIAALKEKYGGNLRYILVYYLNPDDCPCLENGMTVALEALQQQAELYSLGWQAVQLCKEKKLLTFCAPKK